MHEETCRCVTTSSKGKRRIFSTSANGDVVTASELGRMLPKKYRQRNLIVSEILSVLCQYNSFKPVMDIYVFNDGSRKNPMSLRGKIPVCHTGMGYVIPVCLWILDSYPLHPPICYVKPSNDTMIRRSENIDPYLQEWKPPLSDLYGLIQIMKVMFEEELPLCKRDLTLTSSIHETLDYNFLSLPASQVKEAMCSCSEAESQFILKKDDDSFQTQTEFKC
ncbi:tumor susceptibility gene 101 protein-like isoform X1 [Arapaima gigas]